MTNEPTVHGPQDTMDDITSISSGKAIEEVNTQMVSKNIELSAKTIMSIIAGAILGLIMFMLLFGLVGTTVGVAVFMACTVAVPFLMVGTVKDATQEVRWRRALHTLQSRNIEGQVFYVNSLHAENIVDLQEMIVR